VGMAKEGRGGRGAACRRRVEQIICHHHLEGLVYRGLQRGGAAGDRYKPKGGDAGSSSAPSTPGMRILHAGYGQKGTGSGLDASGQRRSASGRGRPSGALWKDIRSALLRGRGKAERWEGGERVGSEKEDMGSERRGGGFFGRIH